MKEKVDIYKEYCAGCGLCHSAEAVQYEYKNGFFKPELQQNNFSFCEGVCPASGNWLKNIDPKRKWGKTHRERHCERKDAPKQRELCDESQPLGVSLRR